MKDIFETLSTIFFIFAVVVLINWNCDDSRGLKHAIESTWYGETRK